MRRIPDELAAGPFGRAQAAAVGVTKSMLQGSRFIRLHQGVWRAADHVMSPSDWVRAGALALPAGARSTDVTRLQQLGLVIGPSRPVHFVVEGDHHLAIPGVFLHRTVSMPPTDDVGVRPCAAYVAFCSQATVLEAIAVGDWLLHHGHMSLAELHAFVVDQPWRRGAPQAAWVFDELRPGSRSIRESHTRAMIVSAGLPEPECNAPVRVTPEVTVLADLYFRRWKAAVEYEGEQHQEDRAQYVADISRYTLYRRAGVGYRQVTKELMRSPRAVVRAVHELLLECGYDGSPPQFGDRWEQLFMRLSHLVRRQAPATGRRGAVSQD